MPLTQDDLNGTYFVTTGAVQNYEDFEGYSDGMTQIENGETNRVDGSGCAWKSTFKVLSDTEVEMTSVVDPSDTDPDFKLITPEGEETREPLTYTTVLQVSEVKGKLLLSGPIRMGDQDTTLTMKKL